jgi:hypothetical protein
MNYHVQKKFPEHSSLIGELMQRNDLFAEMCADYEEVCTWLAGRTSKEELTAEEYSVAQDLIRELESEIAAAFEKKTK